MSDDTLVGDGSSTSFSDTVGNNTFFANAGDDTITTGTGDDTIRPGSGNDSVDAGDGNNRVFDTDGADTINTGTGNDIVQLYGGGNNTVTDTGGNNRVFLSFGNDTVRAGGGNDFIDAGDGANDVTVAGGINRIFTGTGADSIEARAGTNTIITGSGGDTIVAGAGADTIHSGGGNDTVTAGNGDNLVIDAGGNNTITTGSGADVVRMSGPGTSTINTNGGDDKVIADSGDNTITTGAGADIVVVEGGDDDIATGTEDDRIVLNGGGDDTVDGGQGVDRVIVTSVFADFHITVSPANITLTHTGTGDVITLVDVEVVVFADGARQTSTFTSTAGPLTVNAPVGTTINDGGSDGRHTTGAGNDTVADSGGNNRIYTNAGDDTVTAGSGDDTIRSGGGNDNVDAGDGNNRVFDTEGTDTVATGIGDDLVKLFGSGNKTVTDTGGNNRIFTSVGDDTITAGSGDDRIDAADGANTVMVAGGSNRILTGKGADTIRAQAGTNVINTASGDDDVVAGAGNDTIRSGGGNDTVDAGGGDNLVIDTGGSNTITTGSGADVVQVSGPGASTITTNGGDDKVFALGGTNTIDTGAGRDAVVAEGGDDNISTGSEDDRIVLNGGGKDTVDGGSGFDRLFVASAFTDFVVSLAQNAIVLTNTTSGDELTIIDVERISFNGDNRAATSLVPGANFAPILADDNGATDANTKTTVDVLFNDGDPDGDRLTIARVEDVPVALAGPAVLLPSGALVRLTAGGLEYDPNGAFASLSENAIGHDSFTYRAEDGQTGFSTAQVTIAITGLNDAPTMAGRTTSATSGGGEISIDLSALGDDPDSNEDGASLGYEITGAPASGAARIDGTTLFFDPGSSFPGLLADESVPVTISVIAKDGSGAASAPATVTVNVTGPARADGAVTVALADDTGTSGSDGLTTDPTIVGNTGGAPGLRAELVGITPGGAQDISGLVDPASTFTLDAAALAALNNGAALSEGEYTLTLTTFDRTGGTRERENISFELDTTPPDLLGGPSGSFSTRPATLTLTFDEPISAASLASAAISLVDDNGAPVTITSADLNAGGASATLNLAAPLGNGAYTLSVSGTLVDVAGASAARNQDFSFTVDAPTAITAISPADGTKLANVHRNIIVEFDGPVDPTTVNANSIGVTVNGEAVLGTYVVSSNGRLVTFRPNEDFPASANVRVTVDGDILKDADGNGIDGDGDGVAGGAGEVDFATVSLTRIPDTNVEGFIFDSNNRGPNGEDLPLEGVIVTVVGLPGVQSITDENGRFFLEDLPVPDVYLHFDATPVSAQTGFQYGTIVKPAHTKAGETVTMTTPDGTPFNIYFAAFPATDSTPVVPGEDTEAGLGAFGLQNLEALFPDIDPSEWEKIKVVIPADALSKDDGTLADSITVMAFEPDRIPAPTPPGFDPAVVFTVSGNGANNVDGKAQIEFPNLDGAAPGTKLPIMSFDHDAGKWVKTGTAIVSEDGAKVVSEGDTGVNTLGWKFVGSAPSGSAGNGSGSAGGGTSNARPSAPAETTTPPDTFEEKFVTVPGFSVANLGRRDDIFQKIAITPNGFGDGSDVAIYKIKAEVDAHLLEILNVTGVFNSDRAVEIDGNRLVSSQYFSGLDTPNLFFDINQLDLKTIARNNLANLEGSTIYTGSIKIVEETEFQDGSRSVLETNYFISDVFHFSPDRRPPARDQSIDGQPGEIEIYQTPRVVFDVSGVDRGFDVPLNLKSGSTVAPLITLETPESRASQDNPGSPLAPSEWTLTHNTLTFRPLSGVDSSIISQDVSGPDYVRETLANLVVSDPRNGNAESERTPLIGNAVEPVKVYFLSDRFENTLEQFIRSSESKNKNQLPFQNQNDIANSAFYSKFTEAQTKLVTDLFDTQKESNDFFDDLILRVSSYFENSNIPVEFEVFEGAGPTVDGVSVPDDEAVSITVRPAGLSPAYQGGSIRLGDTSPGLFSERFVKSSSDSFDDIELEKIQSLLKNVNNSVIATGEIINALDAAINLEPFGNIRLYTADIWAWGLASFLKISPDFGPIPGNTLREQLLELYAVTAAHEIGNALSLPDIVFDNDDTTQALGGVFDDVMGRFTLYSKWLVEFDFTDGAAEFATFDERNVQTAQEALKLYASALRNGIIETSTKTLALEFALDPETGLPIPSGGLEPPSRDTVGFDGQFLVAFDASSTLLIGGVDFGDQDVDAGAAERRVELVNFGQTEISAITPTVPASSPFTVTVDPILLPIGPGESVFATVAFDPATTGTRSEEVTFTTGAGETLVVAVEGTGTSADPFLTITAGDDNFGGVLVDGGTKVVAYTLANEGDAPLEITGVAIVGADFSAPSLANPITLQAGDTTTVNVTFDPSRIGLATAQLQITSNTASQSDSVARLNGTGVTADPELAWGSDHVLVQIGDTDFRTISNENGNFGFTLPSDRPYTITIFDPDTGLVATGFGTTAPAGGYTNLLNSLQIGASTAPDTDGEGLPDDVEGAIGSSASRADTNGDGISDFDQLLIGQSPLAGLSALTGTLGAVKLGADANDVVVTASDTNLNDQFAYVGTDSDLSIIDVSNLQNPILLGRLSLAGGGSQVVVDTQAKRAFLAAGEFGVHVVDISDPVAPKLVTTIREMGRVDSLLMVDGQLVTGGAELAVLSPLTGEVVSRSVLPLPPLPAGSTVTQQPRFVTGLAEEGGKVFALFGVSAEAFRAVGEGAVGYELISLNFDGTDFSEIHRIDVPIPTIRKSQAEPPVLRLAIDDGVAFVANGIATASIAETRPKERGGLLTFDVSDPANLSLISDIDTGDFAAGNLDTAPTGTGLGAVAGGPFGLQIYDLSDPQNTFDVTTTFDTPGSANGVFVSGTIAYVADGSQGLRIIQYATPTTDDTAPVITLNASGLDTDPNTPGVQVREGQIVSLPIDIDEAGQLRNTELLLGGDVVKTVSGAPTLLTFRVPAVTDGVVNADLSVAVRGTDAAGNRGLSQPITLDVLPDSVAPVATSISPANGARQALGRLDDLVVRVVFSEPVDPATISLATTTLISSANVAAPADGFALSANGTIATWTFSGVQTGDYTVDLGLGGVADFSGNTVAGGDVRNSVRLDFDAIFDDGSINSLGLWDDPLNWDGDVLPGRTDVARVSDVGGALPIESASDVDVERVILSTDLRISAGLFRTDAIEMTPTGTLAVPRQGGTLKDAAISGGRTELDGGTFQNVTFNGPAFADESRPGHFGGHFENVTLNDTLTIDLPNQPPSTLAENLQRNQNSVSFFETFLKTITFTGSQTLAGTGEIILKNSDPSKVGPGTIVLQTRESTLPTDDLRGDILTIGAGIEITGSGTVGAEEFGNSVRILGDVTADDGFLLLRRVDQGGAALKVGASDDGHAIIERLRNADLDVDAGDTVGLVGFVGRASENVRLVGAGHTVITGGLHDGLNVGGTGTVSARNAGFANLTVDTALRLEAVASPVAFPTSVAGNANTLYATNTIDGTVMLAGSDTTSVELNLVRATILGSGRIVLDDQNAPSSQGPVNTIHAATNVFGVGSAIGAGITIAGDGAINGFFGTPGLKILGTLEGVAGDRLTAKGILNDGGTLSVDADVGVVALDGFVQDTVFANAPGAGPTNTLHLFDAAKLVDVTFAMNAAIDTAAEGQAATVTTHGTTTLQGATLTLKSDGTNAPELLVNGGGLAGTGIVAMDGQASLAQPTLAFAGLRPSSETMTIGANVTVDGEGLIRGPAGAGDILDIRGSLVARGLGLTLERLGTPILGDLTATANSGFQINDAVTLGQQATTVIDIDAVGTNGTFTVFGDLALGGLLSLDVDAALVNTLQEGDTFVIAQYFGFGPGFTGAFDGFQNFDLPGNLAFALFAEDMPLPGGEGESEEEGEGEGEGEGLGIPSLILRVVQDDVALPFITSDYSEAPIDPPVRAGVLLDELSDRQEGVDLLGRQSGTGPITVVAGNGIGLSNVELSHTLKLDAATAAKTVTVDQGLILDLSDLELEGSAGNQARVSFRGEQTVSGLGSVRLRDPGSLNETATEGTFSNELVFLGDHAGHESLTFAAGVDIIGSGFVGAVTDPNVQHDFVKILGTARGGDGGTLVLKNLDNDGTPLKIVTDGGDVQLRGHIRNTTLTDGASSGSSVVELGGTIDPVTLHNVDLSMDARVGSATSVTALAWFDGGVSFDNATVTVGTPGGSAFLAFAHGQVIGGTGTIVLPTPFDPTGDGTGEVLFGLESSSPDPFSEPLQMGEDITVIGTGKISIVEDIHDFDGAFVADNATLFVTQQSFEAETFETRVFGQADLKTELRTVFDASDLDLKATADGMLDIANTTFMDRESRVIIAIDETRAGEIAFGSNTFYREKTVLDGAFVLEAAPGSENGRSVGDEIVILRSAAGFDGSFDTTGGMDLPGALAFALIQEETQVSLVVVDDPLAGVILSRSEADDLGL